MLFRSAFNSDTGALTVKKAGKRILLEMSEQSVQLAERTKAVEKVDEKIVESVELTKLLKPKSQKVYLRIDADFRPSDTGHFGGSDKANFFYSLDGEQWTKIGTSDYRLSFDWRRFFMGQKFGIFNYATKKAGGYVDVDRFSYEVTSEK